MCIDVSKLGGQLDQSTIASAIHLVAVFYMAAYVLEDVDEISESHILGNVPVARLMLAESCLNTPNCEHKPRRARESASSSHLERSNGALETT
jgi:hypothetical protein